MQVTPYNAWKREKRVTFCWVKAAAVHCQSPSDNVEWILPLLSSIWVWCSVWGEGSGGLSVWYHLNLFDLLGFFNRWAPQDAWRLWRWKRLVLLLYQMCRMQAGNPGISLLNMQCSGTDAFLKYFFPNANLLFFYISFRNKWELGLTGKKTR